MFSVCHADSILHYLLSTLYLLHNSHQLPRILGYFVCESLDAVSHVQNGGTDLISFTFKKSMLEIEVGDIWLRRLWLRRSKDTFPPCSPVQSTAQFVSLSTVNNWEKFQNN